MYNTIHPDNPQNIFNVFCFLIIQAPESQLIQCPTRIPNNVKSTIDLIFDMGHITESGVLPISISDHLPIYVIKMKERSEKSFHTIRGRIYKQYNKCRLSDSLMADGMSIGIGVMTLIFCGIL